MLTILNQLSKSLSVELTKFLQRFVGGKTGSKQAFSIARYHIGWQAFEELNELFVTDFYQIEPQTVRRWNGQWLLLATDGSDYELPWESSLREAFGVANNGQGQKPICMAKGVKIWDALNGITLSAELGRYDRAELMHFKNAWDKALSVLQKAGVSARRLLLGDRHYPAFWLVWQLQSEETDFLFRCPPTFCRESIAFMDTGQKEAVIVIPIASDAKRRSDWKRQTGKNPPDSVQFRILRDDAPNGEPFCLITSLRQEEAKAEELLALYPARWGEEVSFFFDKIRFEVENFAARKPDGIRQEWYAQLLAANMAQLFVDDAQEILNEQQQTKNNKHRYQINRSVAIGILRDELPNLIAGIEEPEKFYERILPLIVAHRQPVRKNRHFKRARSHKLKFSKNLRSVI
ncbi:MAG: transposase [Saprospiraceae bacterium]|nr:transposase [Saprospiraceae bacterium]